MALDAGSRVSHYRLLRRLGAGGMGEVFLAEDDDLKRPVAIKFLLGTSDDHARKRLLQEARAVASLDHPGICAVHEIGSDAAGGDFIVMQYVEGESLHARLQRGRLPPGEALALASHIAEALRAAHARGIVHRDLKPQNIMITPAGEPKLLDFGLAKRVAAAAQAAEAQTATQLTQPYAVMGTPGYMSPEQIRGRPADYRSDLFALGCVLYECLTGHRAFNGQTAADIASEVLQIDPPPVSSLAPGLDASHDVLVARLLMKAPEDRFQSAGDALGAIRVLAPSAISSRTAIGTGVTLPRRRLGRSGMLAVALGAALVVALAIWQPWRRGLPAAPPEAQGWYERGIEALREGTYATARSSLQEAVKLYPQYVLAYLRLAEALSELDDALGANAALVTAGDVMPKGARLSRDEQLRLDAVRASVLRQHERAIDAYRKLAELYPDQAGGWLDVGRAEEAAGRRPAALQSYTRALALNSQYAAAHLRLGSLRVEMGQTKVGAASIDEAIRLYDAANHTEGKAEALRRLGQMLTTSGEYVRARAALEGALKLAGDGHPYHRVRAQFDLARLTAVGGNYVEAAAIGRDAVAQAVDAGLHASASNGLIDLAYSLTLATQYDAADDQLERAIALAAEHRAKRVEMRARLQQAALRSAQGRPRDAIALSELPLRYFAEQRYVRVEADGKRIISRALEQLEEYGEAARLSTEVLRLAESMQDDALVADSLEDLAGQLANQGRLPEALAHRERIEKIHREQQDHRLLAYDLPNRAELLIRLGRAAEAGTLLDEVDQRIAEGVEAYSQFGRRVSMLRALLATTLRRFHDAAALARPPAVWARPNVPPDRTARLAAALLEHALAQLGQSRTPATAIAAMPDQVSSPVLQRELRYWAAQTLLARREFELSYSTAVGAWSAAAAKDNAELRWRVSAVASLARRHGADSSDSATMRAHANRDRQQLTTAWAQDAMRYFARPDLTYLLQQLDER